MRRIRYLQLDVFTSAPFGGNQLAVFFDAARLTAEEMQAIAREMNFSESVFTLGPTDPQALARLRAIERLRAGEREVDEWHASRAALDG